MTAAPVKKTKLGSPRQHRGVSAVIFTIFLWLYAVISLYPLLWMIFYSFKSNEEIFVSNPFGPPINWQFQNYVNAWTQYDVPLYFQNSVIVGAATVGICIICAMMFTFPHPVSLTISVILSASSSAQSAMDAAECWLP